MVLYLVFNIYFVQEALQDGIFKYVDAFDVTGVDDPNDGDPYDTDICDYRNGGLAYH